MRPEDILFDGITNIREDLIEEAQQYVFRRRAGWRRYAGLTAACLALALGLHLLLQLGGMNTGSGGNSGGAANSEAVPETSMDAVPSGKKCFSARVVEINGSSSLVVVPQPGSGIWSVADRVTVPISNVPDMPDVQPGDCILIFYTGIAGTDYVEGVTEIEILD